MIRRSTARALITAALMAGLGSAPAFAQHDQPDAAYGGGVSLPLSTVEGLEHAFLVEPAEYLVFQADIDRQNKTVSIQGIPPGKYDLLLKFTGVVLEGLTLDVPGGYEPLSDSDRQGLAHITWISDDYFNQKHITRMGGNGKRVKMLVEQVRNKTTYDTMGHLLEGAVIRRLELTEMRKSGQVWTIARIRHLFREERKHARDEPRLRFLYLPGLGGIRVGDDLVKLEKFDPAAASERRPAHFYSDRNER